jgi:fatty acyl-CoA reductase
MNLERLRMAMEQNTDRECHLDFDPKTIDWDSYFYKVHIPGVLKYLA